MGVVRAGPWVDPAGRLFLRADYPTRSTVSAGRTGVGPAVCSGPRRTIPQRRGNMTVDEAADRLRQLLLNAGFDFAHPRPELAWEVFKRFAAEPVESAGGR